MSKAIIIHSPGIRKGIVSLELIHVKAVRIIPVLKSILYMVRLEALNLLSLGRRQLRDYIGTCKSSRFKYRILNTEAVFQLGPLLSSRRFLCAKQIQQTEICRLEFRSAHTVVPHLQGLGFEFYLCVCIWMFSMCHVGFLQQYKNIVSQTVMSKLPIVYEYILAGKGKDLFVRTDLEALLSHLLSKSYNTRLIVYQFSINKKSIY